MHMHSNASPPCPQTASPPGCSSPCMTSPAPTAAVRSPPAGGRRRPLALRHACREGLEAAVGDPGRLQVTPRGPCSTSGAHRRSQPWYPPRAPHGAAPSMGLLFPPWAALLFPSTPSAPGSAPHCAAARPCPPALGGPLWHARPCHPHQEASPATHTRRQVDLPLTSGGRSTCHPHESAGPATHTRQQALHLTPGGRSTCHSHPAA